MDKTIKVHLKRPVLRHKMYKSGKQWITAGVVGMAAMTLAMTAHADTTTEGQSAPANGQQSVSNGGNAVTATNSTTAATNTFSPATINTNAGGGLTESKAAAQSGSITTQVPVDHSGLDQAVQNAKNAGVDVSQKPTDSQTVSQSQVGQAKQNIQNDYNAQMADLQAKTNRANHDKGNYESNNGSKGDTSALDAVVKEAQNTPGLTVTKDADNHLAPIDPSNDNAIDQGKSNMQSDYNGQISAIQNAIATQKQNNQEYDQENSNFQQKIKSLTTDQHATGSSFFMNGSDNKNGYMKIDYNYDVTYHYNMATDQIIVTNIKINLNREEPTQKGNGFWDTVIFANPNANLPQELGNYYLPNGDLPGINGDSLWNKYGNNNKDVFAFVSQNNQTEQYTIKYNTSGITPYAVNRNSDGTFTLFKTMDRGNLPNHSGNGDQGWHIWWINGNLKKTITVPQAPQRKTTEVHYHYDVMNVTPPVGGDRYKSSYQYHDLYTTETPHKNYVAGSQVVNNKTEINNDVINARVDMQVPSNSDVTGGYSKLALADNYTKMAGNVTYQGARVLENNIDATNLYTINNDSANHVVTATKNNPSQTNGGEISLVINFKVNDGVKKGTKLQNSGSGTINNSTVPTETVEVTTFTQAPAKHWVEGSQVVDGRTYINDDVVTTDVNMDLPDPNSLAQPLGNVTLTDDYRKFASDVDLMGYRVEENGRDVTSDYSLASNEAGILSVTRKDPQNTPAGMVHLIATFKVHDNVPTGTQLVNSGSGRINNHTVPTNNATVVTFSQTPTKHWVEGGQTVDDKTYINGDTVHAQVEMNLPDKGTLAKPLNDVTLTDNYSDYVNDVVYQSAHVYENNVDVTDQYTIANANGQVVASRKVPANAPSGYVRLAVDFVTNKDLPSGTQLVNRGSGRINNHTVPTNNAKVITYVQATDKHWVEGSQTVDGKTYVDGDAVHGQVTMSLPEPSTLAKKLSNVSITDNYTNFQDKVTYVGAHVYENGRDVTDQYTINNANGQVTAMRKNAQSTPGGQLSLNVDWTINQNVPSGTKMTNSGFGTINKSTVNTPNRDIFTYSQPVSKHWVEGSQTVDGKTYIDDDLIHAQVTMGLPQPSSLAKKLTGVQLVDDYSNFANMVTVKSITVLEGGKDVTSLYNVVDQNGHITATRKDPASTPAGNAQLNITWAVNHDVKSGTRFHNNSWGIINNHSVNSNEADIVTYTPQTGKHWVEGSQTVDNKTYIDNDIANAQVTMSLPDPSTLAKKLTKVEIADDYGQLAQYASLVTGSVKVLENGQDVTNQYNVTTSNNQIIATRKEPGAAPAGNVVLKAQFHIFATTPSNTKLVNSGWGTLNDDKVPTNTPSIVTYKQTTDKHWTEGSQIVDGKVYIDADEVHSDVTMSLPDPSTLAKKLSNVTIIDNYTDFKDKVDYLNAQVFENGKDVTDLYSINNDAGYVTAIRKDPATTPQGTVDLHVNFNLHDDVPTGTVLTNRGSGQLNNEVVNTPDRTIKTFKQDASKNWQEGDQIVNGKLYIDNDEAHSQISTTLPDPSTLAKKLSSVVITDDYSNFSKYADVNNVTIRENGNDATKLYNIQIDQQSGTIVATRKDASATPGGKAIMYVTFHVHDDVPNNTQFVNKGTVKINNETVPTKHPTVSTYKQTTDKHWVEGSQSVDNKTYIDGDKIHGQVTMSLPEPSNLAKKLTNVSITDDYRKFAQDVDYVSANVVEDGKDVTDQYTISNTNGIVTAVRKDPSSTPGGNVELNVTWTIHNDVASGTSLVNSGSGTLNSETVPTPDRTIKTFKQTTDKHWVEGSQIVDGKTFIDGDTVTGQVTMSLPEPTTLAKKLSNVSITDDYSKFANEVDYKSAKVFENGKDVTDQYNFVVRDGKVTAIRKDAASAPNGQVMLQVAWTVHTDVVSGTQLVNSGSGTINSETVQTPDRTIVTYKQDTDKHWINNSGQVVDGKVTINGDVVTARVNMTLPKRSEMGGKFNKIQLIDDYSKFANKVSLQDIHVYENGKDMTNQYNISVENGHVIATRKDPNSVDNTLNEASLATMMLKGKTSEVNPNAFMSLATVNVNGNTTAKKVANDVNFSNGTKREQNQASNNGGQISLVINYKVNSDVESGTRLINAGSGSINDEIVPTNKPNIVTYKQEDNKHWMEGNQKVDGKVYVDGATAHAVVSTTLPDPETLIEPLSNLQLADDYSKFATLVDVVSTSVLENGKDVTKEYNILQKNGQIIATRKNASEAPAGTAQLKVDFKIHDDVKTDTDLINSGSATINKNTVPTNTPKVVTYKPQGEKHWVLNDNQTDNKFYIIGDQATAQIAVKMPSNLAKPLTKFQITDNYSAFKDDVKVSKVSVLENGKDVTNEYNIVADDSVITATRKDASKVNGGNALLVTTFTINNDTKNGEVLENSGEVSVDQATSPVPPVKIITWKPSAVKDVEVGKVSGDTTASANGKLVADGQTLTYPLSTNSFPADRAEDITSHVIKDTLDDNVKYLGYKAFIQGKDGKLADVTEHVHLTQNGKELTFTDDNTLLTEYNKDKSVAASTPIIDVFVQANGTSKNIKNQFTVYTNQNVTQSNVVTNTTPEAAKPTKEDLNDEGVNIDGKTVLPGSVNDYKLLWDLDQYKGIEASADEIANGFYYVDDYPEEALDANPSAFTVTTESGENVKGLSVKKFDSLQQAPNSLKQALQKKNINPKGAFIVWYADDPAEFFKDYVQTGKSLVIKAPMTVKDAFEGNYTNQAYQVEFGSVAETNVVSNNVSKINVHKDVVVSIDDQKSLNGSSISLNQTFDYKLEGAQLPQGLGTTLNQYGFKDDYDQAHDQYNGQYSVLLDTDVTLKDGTVLKKGTDVSKYTLQTIDTTNGSVDIEFDKNFLKQVDFDKGSFGASAYLNMKRIKAGDVYNKYTNVINGKEYLSNTVVTHTAEPKKSEDGMKPVATPTPNPTPTSTSVVTPTTVAPQVKTPVNESEPSSNNSELPQTGNDNSEELLGLLALGVVGTMMVPMRKKRYN